MPGLGVGSTKRLFDLTASTHYDVMPDGRFLLVAPRPRRGIGLRSANVVLSWFAELKKKVQR